MSGAVAAIDPRTLPRLIVPPPDEKPWPTLGTEVRDWVMDNLCHGPGDILGQPISDFLPEKEVFFDRAYEVHPHGSPSAGRRRFKRVILSRRKGLAKTEDLALIAICELDPEAPVRFDHWETEDRISEADWEQQRRPLAAGHARRVVEHDIWFPAGRGVIDPYIPLVATTEEQSEDLAYGAAKAILENCDRGNFYDIGWERIMLRNGPGVMKAVASAPSAREGGRTTFEGFDETHLFVTDRLKGAHTTMVRNIYTKRPDSDPWAMETTTMYAPGEESVAEDSHAYALAVLAGEIEEPTLYFDHRQASELHDLDTKAGLIAAIEEASGDGILFTDVGALIALWRDPHGDRNDFRRFVLNQRRRKSRRWLSDGVWDSLVYSETHPGEKRVVPDGYSIVLVLDGSYSRDSTALVGVTVEDLSFLPPEDEEADPNADLATDEEREPVEVPADAILPHVFVIGHWERPSDQPSWRTPRHEVVEAIDAAFERYEVIEFAPDPPGWAHEIGLLEEKYGDDTVVRFETNQPTRMGPACDETEQAARDRLFTHDGDPKMAIHIGNAITKQRGRYKIIDKPGGQDSPDKIDLAVGVVVGVHRSLWHARHSTTSEAPFAFA